MSFVNLFLVMNNINYDKRKQEYESSYWNNSNGNFNSINGYETNPKDIYSNFLKIIEKLEVKNDCKIIDLGCGNGMLVKFIRQNLKLNVIPFGVDFLEKSIVQAKTIIHPDYATNFRVSNISKVTFAKNSFDIIILDPSLLSTNDFLVLLPQIKEAANIASIFYIHDDVLSALQIQSIKELYTFNDLSFEIYDFKKISFAVFMK